MKKLIVTLAAAVLPTIAFAAGLESASSESSYTESLAGIQSSVRQQLSDRPLSTAAQNVSSLQSVLDRCPQVESIAPFQDANDLAAAYGECLQADAALGIDTVYAPKSDPNTLYIISHANETAIAKMNGTLQLPGTNLTVNVLAEKEHRMIPLTERAAQVQLSSLQAVVNRCLNMGPATAIHSDQEFIQVLGPCLKQDRNLNLVGIDMDKEMLTAVDVISRADQDTVNKMGGTVLIPLEGGDFHVVIRAFKYGELQPL